MSASLNVNLKPCDCDGHIISGGDAVHTPDCASAPVLIPCPIPRSVTFEVVINKGGCAGFEHCEGGDHDPACTMRPVKVSCSISGKTWEESEVTDVETVPGSAHTVYPADAAAFFATSKQLVAACRERWALVKALVLGKEPPNGADFPTCARLWTERDAVYSALADMARAERAAFEAQTRFQAVESITRVTVRHLRNPDDRPSAAMLKEYVERLIEQVGVLP